jgi:hypothetical protein
MTTMEGTRHMSTAGDDDLDLPVTPYYDGTSSGWSGSDTSRERAERHDADGTTRGNQRRILAAAGGTRNEGVTIAELRELFSAVHHGSLSGALSNLHMNGDLARLTETRGKCKVYVLPEYVNGRETELYGRKAPALAGNEARIAATLNTVTARHEANGSTSFNIPTAAARTLADIIARAYPGTTR